MKLKHVSMAVTISAALVITTILGLRFVLMLYFPGTPDTRELFEFMLPRWGKFIGLTTFLTTPVDILLRLMPASAVFPEMPAAVLVGNFSEDAPDVIREAFPGTVEWGTLLAIPVWDVLLVGLNMTFWHLLENRDMLSQMPGIPVPAPKKAPATPKLPSRQRAASVEDASPEGDAPKPAGPAEPSKYKDRLNQVKASQAAPPPVIRPQPQPQLVRESWEEYKKREGDMMVRNMIQQLRQENMQLQSQQQHLRSTFSQYFSPNVARYLEENRQVFQHVENQKRSVSVMFCDIRGFSAYSQTAAPAEMVAFLDEYFSIASYVILHRFDGVINKLMGDGLLAYWGFPLPQEDHAYIATQAALQILKEVDLRNRTTSHPMPLNVGIGIASGEAIVGNIGSADFKDFTLLGVPVNLASRLEEANKRLSTNLLISATTYAGLKGRLECRDCGEVEIRGWQGTERIYAPRLTFADS